MKAFLVGSALVALTALGCSGAGQGTGADSDGASAPATPTAITATLVGEGDGSSQGSASLPLHAVFSGSASNDDGLEGLDAAVLVLGDGRLLVCRPQPNPWAPYTCSVMTKKQFVSTIGGTSASSLLVCRPQPNPWKAFDCSFATEEEFASTL